ncbi:MAG: GNAT family N-acetyltransferase [Candidatus Zixiibacteriota bacterium]
MHTVQLTLNDSPIVLEFVKKLLIELAVRPEEETLGDTDKILSDWKEAGNRFTAFAAYDGDKVVGVITLVENFAIYAGGWYGIINELYIEPDYRSKGVGKTLLETVNEYGRRRGWKRIDVTAPPGEAWERTVNFYKREGFVFTGPKLKVLL